MDVQCPYDDCGRFVQYPGSLAGQVVRCSICNRQLQLPAKVSEKQVGDNNRQAHDTGNSRSKFQEYDARPKWDFSFFYPVDWTIEIEDEPATPFTIAVAVAAPDRGEGSPSFMVNAYQGALLSGDALSTKNMTVHFVSPQPRQLPASINEYIERATRELRDSFRGFQLIEAEQIEFAFGKAAKMTYSYVGNHQKIQETCITRFSPFTNFQLITECPADCLLQQASTMEHVIHSFRIFGVDVSSSSEEPPILSKSEVDAARSGNLPEIKASVQAAPQKVHSVSKDGVGLLLYAASSGHAGIVEFLIANGADVNATNTATQSALHLASASGFPMIVDILARSGADVNMRDGQGYTPMDIAGFTKHPHVMATLLKYDARVTRQP